MAEYELAINFKNCVGCRLCEQVCSIHNALEVNPQKARIRIVNLKEEASTLSIPVRCMQCEDPICEVVCPTGAISTNPVTGARVVNKEKCIGCRTCVYSCPFGAAAFDRLEGKAFMCDLCNGDPLCARWCPFEALQYIKCDEASIKLKRDRTNKLLEFLRLSSEKIVRTEG